MNNLFLILLFAFTFKELSAQSADTAKKTIPEVYFPPLDPVTDSILKSCWQLPHDSFEVTEKDAIKIAKQNGCYKTNWRWYGTYYKLDTAKGQWEVASWRVRHKWWRKVVSKRYIIIDAKSGKVIERGKTMKLYIKKGPKSAPEF